jgi:hypothetical protein
MAKPLYLLDFKMVVDAVGRENAQRPLVHKSN